MKGPVLLFGSRFQSVKEWINFTSPTKDEGSEDPNPRNQRVDNFARPTSLGLVDKVEFGFDLLQPGLPDPRGFRVCDLPSEFSNLTVYT